VTHHHHQAGRSHPSPALTFSLLRLSALRRLGLVAVVVAAMWVAVAWALS
jgi:hypothetical protein